MRHLILLCLYSLIAASCCNKNNEKLVFNNMGEFLSYLDNVDYRDQEAIDQMLTDCHNWNFYDYPVDCEELIKAKISSKKIEAMDFPKREYDASRENVLQWVEGFILFFEHYKYDNWGGIPPDISTKEMMELFKAQGKDFTWWCLPEMTFKEIEYQHQNNQYIFYMILKYKAKGAKKYSAVKVVDGMFYWKDNFAEETETVKDLDWDKVNFLWMNDRRGPDGNAINHQYYVLPNYVE